MISVHRQQNEGRAPAVFGATPGTLLAGWQAGLEGLDWINDLVRQEKAISLGGIGYPCEFTAMGVHLKARIFQGPPGARQTWQYGKEDDLKPQYLATINLAVEAWRGCPPDEWLLIYAWDES